MSPVAAGIAGIVLLLVFFLLRMPVAFAMAFVGFLGFAYLADPGPALSLLALDIFEVFTSYPLSVIPMFILMGTFAFASGISRRLYHTAYIWVGPFRGGLTMATVIACAGFGAICGSSTATAATMGKIALPEMKKYKYDDSLATGTVAAAGTLGVMIPPSTVFIVYGILTEESIGKLFIAGVLPGILLSLSFVATVAILCMRNPALGPPGPPTSWGEKFRSTIPFKLADWVGSLPIHPLAVIGVLIFIYFIGGFFMDSMALIVVTIPIFFPVVMKLGFDSIWFGVIVVLVAEMGVITPPVGVNVFVLKGIAPDVPLEVIFKGIFPFLAALIIVTIILVFFPQIATFLPNLVH